MPAIGGKALPRIVEALGAGARAATTPAGRAHSFLHDGRRIVVDIADSGNVSLVDWGLARSIKEGNPFEPGIRPLGDTRGLLRKIASVVEEDARTTGRSAYLFANASPSLERVYRALETSGRFPIPPGYRMTSTNANWNWPSGEPVRLFGFIKEGVPSTDRSLVEGYSRASHDVEPMGIGDRRVNAENIRKLGLASVVGAAGGLGASPLVNALGGQPYAPS